jgi:hypothetical protein
MHPQALLNLCLALQTSTNQHCVVLIAGSSTVERSAVNRNVRGSNPAHGSQRVGAHWRAAQRFAQSRTKKNLKPSR